MVMEEIVGSSCPKTQVMELEEDKNGGVNDNKRRLRMTKKNLEMLLQECQRTLELVRNATTNSEVYDDNENQEKKDENCLSQSGDSESQISDLLKSAVESPNFLGKLESAQASVSQSISAEEGNSWSMINENDLWEGDEEGYVLVNEEDIVEGISSFMATYLLSIQQNRELSPNQLQEALSKTFSVKKKKGKLQKAWDGSKVVYNVASWGATAVGIYQNPAIFKAASLAFWSSCRIISKLL